MEQRYNKIMTVKPWRTKKINGHYVYDYPENRKIGKKLKGAYSYISRELLQNKYTPHYVAMVFRGVRHNDEIVQAGLNYLKFLESQPE